MMKLDITKINNFHIEAIYNLVGHSVEKNMTTNIFCTANKPKKRIR